MYFHYCGLSITLQKLKVFRASRVHIDLHDLQFISDWGLELPQGLIPPKWLPQKTILVIMKWAPGANHRPASWYIEDIIVFKDRYWFIILPPAAACFLISGFWFEASRHQGARSQNSIMYDTLKTYLFSKTEFTCYIMKFYEKHVEYMKQFNRKKHP